MTICPCDHHVHPGTLDIPPGLTRIPRQIAGFVDWRAALLRAASGHPALATWTAREPNDLGVLLLEMWAYACDVVSFADETIAHEAYLRTARRDRSLRELTALLGYRPRPAVAATVDLAVAATGRQPILLPAGTAFRSGAVGDEPPQLFELGADVQVHPLANAFRLAQLPEIEVGESAPEGAVTVEFSELAAIRVGRAVDTEQVIWVSAADESWFVRPADAEPVKGPGPARTVIAFDPPLDVPAATDWRDIEVRVADRTLALWTLDVTGYASQVGVSGDGTELTLDGLHRIFAVGDRVVVRRGDHHRNFTVDAVTEVTYHFTPDASFTINGDTVPLPGVTGPVTRITLDTELNDAARQGPGDTETWDDSIASELGVLAVWRRVAVAEVPLRATVPATADPLPLDGPLDEPEPPFAPDRFALVDRDRRAVTSPGALNWDTETVLLDEATWDPPLRHPVRLAGNLVLATRGETVVGEVLGSGDAGVPNQRFALANSPLTYLGTAAGTSGELATSTLTVRVDGIRWDEVPNFYGTGPDDRVYVTEPTDDGGTEVVFGDGVYGARLPTGAGNVVADYRFGAGAVHPPAESISQLAEPVDGITGVVNPVAAYGGAEAETPDELATAAPASALLLGRAISLPDFEAAARIPGVRAVSARFDWEPSRLRSAVVVAFVGDPSLAEGIVGRLRAMAERSVPISAMAATEVAIAVQLVLTADPRRLAADVEAAVRDRLIGEGGLLTPEGLGIGAPLFRSRLLAEVTAVEGVTRVDDVLVDGAAFLATAVVPGPSEYLDGTAGLAVTITEGVDG